MRSALQIERHAVVKRAIERAALELFSARGYADVSIDDVAAAAGISPRTFFRYFSDKSEVVLSYQRRLDERLLTALTARPHDEGPVTALRRAYEETSTVAEADRDTVLRRARAVAAAPALLARCRGEQIACTRLVASELAARMDAADDDRRAQVVAVAMSAVATERWEAWVADGGQGDPAERIADALALLEQGLASLDRQPAPAR